MTSTLHSTPFKANHLNLAHSALLAVLIRLVIVGEILNGVCYLYPRGASYDLKGAKRSFAQGQPKYLLSRIVAEVCVKDINTP